MLSSLSVPRILCAFDKFDVVECVDLPDEDLGVDGSGSLLACLRPGIGNRNFEVRPIVFVVFNQRSVGVLSMKRRFLHRYTR